MSQHDMNIANQSFPNFRTDLNNALAALVSNSAGATEPTTTFAHQFWVDTAADPSILKVRNSANDAWITVGEIDETNDKFNLKCDNATISENLTLNAQGDLRFADSDSSNYVAFQAPSTVASNVTWILPSADGSSGQALVTNGSGTLSWASSTGDKIEEGDSKVEVVDAGTGSVTTTVDNTEFLKISAAGTVFNETGADHDIRFEGDTDANLLYIDAGADRVGIGTSSPSYKTVIKQDSTGSVAQVLQLENNATIASGKGLKIGFGLGDSAGSTRSYIEAALDSSTRTYLAFATNDGSTGTYERMRIDGLGSLLVGTTATFSPGGVGSAHAFSTDVSTKWGLGVQNTNVSSPWGIGVRYPNAAPNTNSYGFLFCEDSSATRAYIYSDGGLANYSGNNVNLSDRREKTNFAPAKNYLDTICAIPVQTFNYIDQNLEEDAGLTLGVVAQDVQEVAPELVMESDWGTQGNPKMRLSIYQTDLQYALMKCIQELKAENDALKSRLDAAGL